MARDTSTKKIMNVPFQITINAAIYYCNPVINTQVQTM
jgi:hypothetical protein